MRRILFARLSLGSLMLALIAPPVVAASSDKPNILILWGDDIGQSNISAYSMGMMGYQTPNIDRIAKEGMIFTDYYGEQSCTAGRSSFITGQSVYRTGLSKVGLPGANFGMRSEDPTIASMLKLQGYATGQFGKNHLGDLDEHLPTNHGFDEFFGNLYHLNASEEPENEDYPTDLVLPSGKTFLEKFGPRGVIRATARYEKGRVVQEIEDTGPLTRARMEVVDDETSDAAIDFIRRQHAAGKPWFVWWNGTRMHLRTHVKDELRGISGQGEYGDGMVEHDMHVGRFLELLDELGIADNTLVVYSTDNGPHMNSWPDAGMTPFRSEKDTNWEGAFRVPAMVRWPGEIKPGTISNEIVHHMDWFPTILRIAGVPDVKESLKSGDTSWMDRDYRTHLDGYDLIPYLTGEVEQSPRDEVFYFTDDGDLAALRYHDWKIVFMEQREKGTLAIWQNPFTPLRLPYIFNMRRDPYERAQVTSNTYYDWMLSRVYLLVPAQTYTGKFLNSFLEFKPRQEAPSFSVDHAMRKLEEALGR